MLITRWQYSHEKTITNRNVSRFETKLMQIMVSAGAAGQRDKLCVEWANRVCIFVLIIVGNHHIVRYQFCNDSQ